VSQLTGATTKAQGSSFGLDSSVPDFNTETYRMLRDDWQDQGITTFSQEVWALFQLLQDYNTNGTSTYNQTGAQAPITINQPFNLPGNPAITINQLGPNGEIASQLQITPTGINQNGQPLDVGGGSSAFPGSIISQVSGSVYKVSITTESGPLTVNATQIQIDPTAAIPSGTGCVVVQVGSNYYFQVAVWL
jgi:hypothetical protein